MTADNPQPATNSRASRQRLKVLISAYACEPHKGSEPGVGWNVVTEMAKLHDVWVLTRANNQKVIELELARNPVPGLHFIYYDLPKWARWWKRGGRGVQLYYHLWELFSGRVACDAEYRVGFDVAHHVTIVRYWTPSNLRNVKAPLLWGPVGGGESTLPGFKQGFSLKNQMIEVVRDCARYLGELDPLVRKTARKSYLALATTNETAARLRRLNGERVQVLSQLGINVQNTLDSGCIKNDGSGPICFICIGKQVYWKGFDLAIKAFAKSSMPNTELFLVGGGPENKALHALVHDLGIKEHVHFFDWLSQPQLHDLLAKCAVLVHPSLHDSGAFVCLEAMSLGKPVICLDCGGPAVQVTKETGFKIRAATPEQAVEDISVSMQRLVDNPQLRYQMGRAGCRCVKEKFLWRKKAEHFSNLYYQMVNDSLVEEQSFQGEV